MELILFTKIFTGCTTQEVGSTAKKMGFDGLDLAVRRGQCIEPGNARETLPLAMTMWRDMGITVPMLTLEGDFTDPDADGVEAIYEACQVSSIRLVKLGYWRWKTGDVYRQEVSNIRRNLEGFAQLGEKYGVCSLVHTHAGGHYGGNVSSARQLVEGFDPESIGLYIDPAHQALEGEPVGIALGIAGEYMRMIGVKNVCYASTQTESRMAWQSQWCLLNEGLVDWPQAISLIKTSEYSNPLSFHATYSAFRDKDGALQQTARDMEYLRSLLT
jgi:sugar phosphate isomerase/epimerase